MGGGNLEWEVGDVITDSVLEIQGISIHTQGFGIQLIYLIYIFQYMRLTN